MGELACPRELSTCLAAHVCCTCTSAWHARATCSCHEVQLLEAALTNTNMNNIVAWLSKPHTHGFAIILLTHHTTRTGTLRLQLNTGMGRLAMPYGTQALSSKVDTVLLLYL